MRRTAKKGLSQWRRTLGVLPLLVAVGVPEVRSQPAPADTADSLMLSFEMPAVVVTATRGARQLRDVPVPTEVVLEDEIRARGVVRLTDLLTEQAGLAVVHEFGAGLQMQGLNSDYVLILIDGEPVIGRSGGTLDLERLTIRGLDRVEIVRGPSSSLYGSDALAGVVNLITKSSSRPFAANANLRYETNATADLSLSSDFSSGMLSGNVLFNRYSSSGYDLFEDRIGKTVPGFVDYTISSGLRLAPTERTGLRASGRYVRLDQTDEIGLSFNTGSAPIASIGEREEWGFSAGIDQRIGHRLRFDLSSYVSRFTSTTSLELGDSRFDQRYGELEIKTDAVVGVTHLVTVGAGVSREAVEADRVIEGSQTASAGFVYAQHQWNPMRVLDLVSSARLDGHSDYQSRVSPKLSVLYKPSSRVRLRGSIGSGFRAPSFQQRYLDFRNPIGGYQVIGAAGADALLESLLEAGEITRLIGKAASGEALKAEHSWSFNVGADWYPSSRVEIRANVFHNQIYDLIETQLVAERTDGQQVFSYANLDRIRTRGVELNVGIEPADGLSLQVGYQFLDTADLDVLEAVANGSVFKRENGRDRRVRKDEYGGLFQRSRHSVTGHLRYRVQPIGLTASVRGVYRSRYGLFDRNGNLILDDDSEYVPGFVLWNVTFTKSVTPRASVQAGVRNLFNHTDRDLIPSLPGRLIFGGLEISIN